jgi:hypothetical protein
VEVVNWYEASLWPVHVSGPVEVEGTVRVEGPVEVEGSQASAPGAGSPGPYSSDPGLTVGWLYEDPAELANGAMRIRAILGEEG